MTRTAKTNKIKGTASNWESGKLGLDEDYATVATPEEQAALERAIDLKPISIRMPTELIKKMKIIAGYHGVGYQPLIRDVLGRFARAEMINILHQISEQKNLEAALSDEDSPAARQLEKKRA